MDNQKFVVIARSVVKPGRKDELIELLREVRERDESEVGTIVQAFQFEQGNLDVMWEYMAYESPEARNIHRANNDAHKDLIPRLRDIYAVWPYRWVCEPLCAKGIDFT